MVSLYKAIINFKHPKIGWIKNGRFLKGCPDSPIMKRYVAHREIIRVTSNNIEVKLKDAIWIDDKPEPKKETN